jgi:cobalt-precorrin 5A hydrolase
MGCRKGKEADAIRMFAQNCLGDNAIYQEAVCQIASIDIKKEEAGLQALSVDWRIPFVTFSDKELLAVPGEFTPSSFVQKTVGVENVCERSAVLASGQGHLIQKKRAADGMTSAFAIKDWRIRFE